MKSWLVLFVVLVVAGVVTSHVLNPPPKPKSIWIATRATQLHVGAWAANIPEQWRDVHELVDPIQTVPMVPGSRMLLPERGWGGQIVVLPLPPVSGDGCERLAESVRASSKSIDFAVNHVDTATWDGDKGCILNISVRGTKGLLLTRTHSWAGVGVECFGLAATLSTGDGCERVIYGLHVDDPGPPHHEDRNDPPTAPAQLSLAVTIDGTPLTWNADAFAKVTKSAATNNGGESRDVWSLRELAHTLVGPSARVVSVTGADGTKPIDSAAWADARRIPILHTTRRGTLKFRWAEANGTWDGDAEVKDVAKLEIVR